MRSEVIPRGLVGRYQCFGGSYPEDGGNIFLQNVVIYIKVCMVLQTRIPTSKKFLLKI
jgi:hypothetical protein